MKAFIFFLTLFLSVFASHAQSDYSKLDLSLQIATNRYNKQFGAEWGLRGELHINSHWSVLYNYNLGTLTQTNFYAHAPMSLFAVGPVTRFLAENSFTFSDFLGALGIGLLTACIPEGVAYHYPVAYRLDLSAYANPLGLAFIISNNPILDGSVKYDATSGLRLTYYSPIGLHTNVHAQARFTAGYGVYPNVGFGLGYSFGHRCLGE